jgi:hypothetical protein
MIDAERDLYLKAMLDGGPEAAAAALEAERGVGPTTHELLALDELGFVELVRQSVPGSSGSEAAPDLVVEVIGLTGIGREFADDLP